MENLYYKNVFPVSFESGTERVIEGKYVKHTQKGVTQMAGTTWLCYVKVEPFGNNPDKSEIALNNEKAYIESLEGADVGLITEEEFNNA